MSSYNDLKGLGPIERKIRDNLCPVCETAMDHSKKIIKCIVCKTEVRHEDPRQSKDDGDNRRLGAVYRSSY